MGSLSACRGLLFPSPVMLLLLSVTASGYSDSVVSEARQSAGGLVQPGWWIPNGAVYTILHYGNTVYIGGDFTSVGPCVPFGVPVEATTGLPDTSFANPDGIVKVAVPDGSGGWFVGGCFTIVGGTPRANIAHINSAGEVTDWDPGADGQILSLALSGNTIYVGGKFTSIDGQGRDRKSVV
jgi:hypothetical protein